MPIISNQGLTLTMISALQRQQNDMSLLSQQVATGVRFNSLTEYAPSEARNILDFQNGITQRNSYIAAMRNVQARMSIYDTTMSDMESIASQASQIASQNQAYDPNKAPNLLAQVQNYLRQMTNDLNQQVGGRYVYAGVRYTTEPVQDLTTVTTAPSTTILASPALPSYDSAYATSSTQFAIANANATGSFKVGNVSFPLSSIENLSGTTASVTVTTGSGTQTVNLTGLTAGNTPTILATNLAAAVNQIATAVPSGEGIASLTASSSGANVTMSFNGTAPLSVTPNLGGTVGQVTWGSGTTPDGTTAQTPNADANAYTADSVLIDTGFTVTYGVSSNDAAFQRLINGMRLITSAITAGQGGNTATYQTNMQQAATLLSSGITGLQSLHAVVANNQNTLKAQITAQDNAITNLTNQLTDIQKVDLTKVGTEINLLQTQLQASYSSTATLQQLSIVKYL